MRYTACVVGMLLIGGCHRSARTGATVPGTNQADALVAAVRSDSIGTLDSLLDLGVSPDTMASDGTRPLSEAARHHRLTIARDLLARHARLGLVDRAGMRPIDYAMQAGHRDVVTLLTRAAAIRAGASAEAITWFDTIATAPKTGGHWDRFLDGELLSLGLAYAVLVERDDLVRALRRGAEIPNSTGYAPLSIAARFGDDAAVDAMLAAGASPGVEVVGHRHETPLMEAACDGYVGVGRDLIRAGARVNQFDTHRETALIWAVRQGETDYAAMLLAAGADPWLRNASGQTALDIARTIQHTDLIQLLESQPRSRSSALANR